VTPYYSDDATALYLGDCREVLPELGQRFDLAVADPPYGETSLQWDRWPDGWPAVAAEVTGSLWCFGSMRMFLDRRDEFAAWRLSQDVVWRKPWGVGMHVDRFRRVHEMALHWYQGRWSNIHHEAVRETVTRRTAPRGPGGSKPSHWGGTKSHGRWIDDGTRLVHSVIDAASMRRRASIHPVEKPVKLLRPLIEYACPPAGIVLDPFAGSGSTAVAARLSGRRSVLIEADERYCEAIVNRLSQDVLPLTKQDAS
jgi:site-specific DNA-methyltransferase (adenine-specific)